MTGMETMNPFKASVHNGVQTYYGTVEDRLNAVTRFDQPQCDAALQVPGAFIENGQDPARVAEALAVELRTMASWLGVGEVEVGGRGDLAEPLRRRFLS